MPKLSEVEKAQRMVDKLTEQLAEARQVLEEEMKKSPFENRPGMRPELLYGWWESFAACADVRELRAELNSEYALQLLLNTAKAIAAGKAPKPLYEGGKYR